MDKIEELLTRGVVNIYPNKEELEKLLRSGKKLKLYQGFDPTGTDLHLGHLVGLIKLRQWQDLGHKVIFLIGDFTGMIGDPSGKTETRKVLTHDNVLENAKSYKEQASRVLRFKGENAAEVKYNGEWLGKMSAIEFLNLSRLLSVNQVIERDMFQNRLRNEEEVYMNEFLYPVMQAYDSVAMNVDLEIGGNDQMFNMLMGRKLMRQILKKEKFVMTTPLLTDSDGRKIGKTEGNVIGLTDSPNDLFGKIMGLSDDVIVKAFEYLTSVPMDSIKEIEDQIGKGENPIKYKKQLAHELVKMLNDEKSAKDAQINFEKTVQEKELPSEIPVITVDMDGTVLDVLVEAGLAGSKSNAKRLVDQGGVEIDNERINDGNLTFETLAKNDETIIQVGKRRFVKIKTGK